MGIDNVKVLLYWEREDLIALIKQGLDLEVDMVLNTVIIFIRQIVDRKNCVLL